MRVEPQNRTDRLGAAAGLFTAVVGVGVTAAAAVFILFYASPERDSDRLLLSGIVLALGALALAAGVTLARSALEGQLDLFAKFGRPATLLLLVTSLPCFMLSPTAAVYTFLAVVAWTGGEVMLARRYPVRGRLSPSPLEGEGWGEGLPGRKARPHAAYATSCRIIQHR